jgi:hypothetical protein
MSFDTVVVRVGKPSVEILVYKDLVCSVSSYFRGAIGRSFLGVKEGTITLRDVSETTFRTFLAWCHAQCLPSSVPDVLLAPSDHFKDKAEIRNVVSTKNLVMRRIHLRTVSGPPNAGSRRSRQKFSWERFVASSVPRSRQGTRSTVHLCGQILHSSASG